MERRAFLVGLAATAVTVSVGCGPDDYCAHIDEEADDESEPPQ